MISKPAHADAAPTPPLADARVYTPGQRVRVTQQIARPRQGQSITIEGVVLRFGQQKTGSWFAHSKDDRLWLDRLEIRKDDGEIVVCNLDRYSRVEAIDAPGAR